jgi:thiazolinyl imide reductase
VATSKVLVCGANYGRVYAEAIRSVPDRCELAGILTRGSDASRSLAEDLGVPLFRDPEEVPDDIRFACVAVPSSETRLLPTLMARGVHVLSDHPVHPTALESGLGHVAEQDLVLHVNGHFSRLAAPAGFARACRRMAESVQPVFIDVLTTDRLLYGALDTLRMGLGSLDPFAFKATGLPSPVPAIQGTLASAACTIQAQHTGAGKGPPLEDGSSEYFLDLRIAVAFPMGVLTLASLAGPVYWNWNLSRALGTEDHLPVTLFDPGYPMAELRDQRREANLDALLRFLECVQDGSVPPDQAPEHLLEVGRVWEALGHAWGW